MQSSTEAVEQYNDVGDRASVKNKEKLAKAHEARRLNGLKQILSSSDGRLWLWGFLSNCGLFSTVFNGNSKDYFNLGQRNAAMPVFAEIQKHFLEEYMIMVKENAGA